MSVHLPVHSADRFKCCQRAPAVGGNSHSKTVDHDVAAVDPIGISCLVDLPGNLQSALSCLRDTVLIQCQANQHTAILFHQRHNRFNCLRFSVHRINHRFSVVITQGCFKRNWIRCVDLKRQSRYALQTSHHFSHHRRLIDIRQTDIDIKYLCTALFLFDTLSQNIIDIVFTQRCLKLFLSCRIDPLTDHHRLIADLNRL